MESGAESRVLSFIKCITPVQPKMITPNHRAYIGCQSKTTGQNRPENKDKKTNHTIKHRVTKNKPAQNTQRA